MDINYSRQQDIFDNTKFNTPIHVIGAGATGSWVTLFLAKLGIKDITVWDFDTVEEHNVPNQIYSVGYIWGEGTETHSNTDIGKEKVEALKNIVEESAGVKIKPKNERVTAKQKLNGIVFCLTDTMKSRKEIFDSCKMNFGVKLWIETRMGLEGGRVYVINPCDMNQVAKYEATFSYTDEEVTTSACGTSQSVVATAVNISSLAVWQVIKYQLIQEGKDDVSFDNEILLDCQNNIMIPQKF